MAADSKKRPGERVLELFPEIGCRVTPSEISAHIGDRYYSKHICQLRGRGFEFDVMRDGITVIAYTLVSEPPNAAEIRAGTKIPIEPKKKKKTDVAARRKPSLATTSLERKQATELLKEAVDGLKSIGSIDSSDLDDMEDIRVHFGG